MTSSPSTAGVAVRAKIALDQIGQPIALVVGGHDDRERGGVTMRAGKDESPKHYNPASRAAPDYRQRACSWRCRLASLLCCVRLPSLAQPMGADQGLYAYVGERILAGELPVSRRLGSEACRRSTTPTR